MNSKEIIRRIIDHDRPPRIGHNFMKKSDDFWGIGAARFIDPHPERAALRRWGKHSVLAERIGHNFDGELYEDIRGNIYGRLNGKTKGECVKGFLQDGWEDFDCYVIPSIDKSYYEELKQKNFSESDKFVYAGFPLSVFSDLRDARIITNAFTDVLCEEEYVRRFLDKICERSLEIIDGLAGVGCDGVMMCDDWGTQDRCFIRPSVFRELFKSAYKVIADALHSHSMKLMLHSCGYVYEYIPDFIDAGIDVLQFDQTEIYPHKKLAQEFGMYVTFFSPIDIQKILPTGNRDYIERCALEMVNNFKNICEGSLIVKDYPSLADIGVLDEWADWARDVVIANSEI